MLSILNKKLFYIFALIFFIAAILFINSVDVRGIIGLDFRAFYTSGLMLQHGVTQNFYDFNTQYFFQNPIFHLGSLKYLMPFFNPPFVALIYFPFSFFALKTAYVYFGILNILVFLAAVRFLFLGNEKAISFIKSIILYTFLFFYFPVWEALWHGQLSFFILLGLTGSWYFFKKSNHFLAGAFLSLILIRPHLIILPLVFLIFKKQWKALLGLVAVSLILLLISLMMVGPQGLLTYVRVLVAIPFMGNNFTVHPQIEPTLRGFLQFTYGSDKLSDVILPLVLGLILIVSGLFYSFKNKLTIKSVKFDLQWSLLVTAVILTSIHTNYHDLTLLIFPVFILLINISKLYYLFLAVIIALTLALLSYNLPFAIAFIPVLILYILIIYKLSKPIPVNKIERAKK